MSVAPSAAPVDRIFNPPTVFADDYTQLPNDHHNQPQRKNTTAADSAPPDPNNDESSARAPHNGPDSGGDANSHPPPPPSSDPYAHANNDHHPSHPAAHPSHGPSAPAGGSEITVHPQNPSSPGGNPNTNTNQSHHTTNGINNANNNAAAASPPPAFDDPSKAGPVGGGAANADTAAPSNTNTAKAPAHHHPNNDPTPNGHNERGPDADGGLYFGPIDEANANDDDDGALLHVVRSDQTYLAELPWHAMPTSAAFRLTNHANERHSRRNGLTTAEAEANGAELGTNYIPVKGGPNALKILFAQFFNSITAILAIVAGVSIAFQDWVEFGVVIAIIVINGALGFYQEYTAALSLDALRKMTSGTAKVVRDGGQISVVEPSVLVVGDIVVLEQGDEVPADIRLFDVSNDLAINEALLTGEAEPVSKIVEIIPDADDSCALGDRKNMAYRSTNLVSGRGRGIVVAAGIKTEMGKLADRLGEAESARTPLMVKMDIMLYILFGCCAILAIIVFAADKMRWSEKNLMYACAVAIAILPESLVVVLTVAFTLSIRRMAQEKCIVRKLGVLEVLGGVTDICSDKTGTLTENKMAVKVAFIGVMKSYSVHGAIRGAEGQFLARAPGANSFAPIATPQISRTGTPTAGAGAGAGNVLDVNTNKDANNATNPLRLDTNAAGPMHQEFFRAASLCATVRLHVDPAAVAAHGAEAELVAEGNPTEIAIQAMAWKADREPEFFEGHECAEKIGEYPFNSSVKRMTTVYRLRPNRRCDTANKKNDTTTANAAATAAVSSNCEEDSDEVAHPTAVYSFTKGAPERVLDLCEWHFDTDGTIKPLTADDRAILTKNISGMASYGLRTICFARRHVEAFPFANLPADPKQQQQQKQKDAAPSSFPDDVAVEGDVVVGDDEDDDEGPAFDKLNERDDVESKLIYLGLVGIQDPPRKESGPSVLICQHAGIKVRMLTGDHGDTAAAIADNLGILGTFEDRSDPKKVMIGPTFDKMTDEDVDALEDLPAVIGRCSPESKVKMIEALHRRGRVVAMTGDGFNDSPSIKKADVGCAMGSGTDVTKGVADIVITDDNFTTIVKAVREGRRISQVIKHFVIHLLAGNIAEVIALIIGLCIRHEDRSVFILSPLQILWLNMVTSSPPAIGLSMDEAGDDILEVPPNTSGLFTAELIADFMVPGAIIGGCCLSSFAFVGYVGNDGLEGTDCNGSDGQNCDVIWTARATAFSVIYVSLLLHAYNVRHPRKSIFQMKWFDNPVLYLNIVFGMGCLMICLYVETIAKNVFIQKQLTWEWGVIAVALVVFEILFEIYKYSKRWIFPIKPIVIDAATVERTHQLVMSRAHTPMGSPKADGGLDCEMHSRHGGNNGGPLLTNNNSIASNGVHIGGGGQHDEGEPPFAGRSRAHSVVSSSSAAAAEREAYRQIVHETLDTCADSHHIHDAHGHHGHDPRSTVQIAHDLMAGAHELQRQKTLQGEVEE